MKGAKGTTFQLLSSEERPHDDSGGGQVAANQPQGKETVMADSSGLREDYLEENPGKSRPWLEHISVFDSQRAASYGIWNQNMRQAGQSLPTEKDVVETKQVTSELFLGICFVLPDC